MTIKNFKQEGVGRPGFPKKYSKFENRRGLGNLGSPKRK